ncbi:MAG TPA: hypothetical protein VGO71_21190 [Baekduia sp.]|jgi:hypothetical protein|nr:hypothetical protein [Baekduia sp.]
MRSTSKRSASLWAAVATAVVTSASLLGAQPALANVTTATKVIQAVDPGSPDTGTYGLAAWRSGSLTVVATRIADGRIQVRAHAKLNARRPFVAQLAISPCEATIPTAMLEDPARYPPIVTPTFKGADVPTARQLHKGLNDVRFNAVASSDMAAEFAPPHWTDCASANVIDQQENAATLRLTPEVVGRQGDTAFFDDPVMLSWTSDDGQHH